ncbi:MAG: hypothetical protein U9R38_01465 [Candidatus Margulisiibacteriota bacterium]|nr:hypothetical protein [Candidatus Margulisiibacteriota bacterium]
MRVKLEGINVCHSLGGRKYQKELPRIRQIARQAAFAHRVLGRIRPEAGSIGERVDRACGFAARTMLTAHTLFDEMKAQETSDAFLCDGLLLNKRVVQVMRGGRTHGVLVFDLGSEWIVADPTIAQFALNAKLARLKSRPGAFSESFLDVQLFLASVHPTENDFSSRMQELFGQSSWQRLSPFDPAVRRVNRRFLLFYRSDLLSFKEYIRFHMENLENG